MKRNFKKSILIICALSSMQGWSKNSTYTTSVPTKSSLAPAQVKITVSNANWVETISICNISSSPIPLTNLELDFNYSQPMPTNIWGNPWAAWTLASQTGTAVVLKGGTPYTPPLQPDPNCTNPMTVQFNAGPTVPEPTGPFVFTADGSTPTQVGSLNITMPAAPASNLDSPTVNVTGANYSNQQVLAWGKSWQIPNLTTGQYTVNSSAINNGTNFYTANPITVTVQDQKVTNVPITYSAVPSGTVNVTLNQAPATQEPLTFSGTKYSFNKTVASGTSLTLPIDTYTVAGSANGYSVSIAPNPITLTANGNVSLAVTYTKNTNPSGKYSTQNGNIIDPNGKIVAFKGVSWFGFNNGNHVVNGLWQSDFNTMLTQIKSLGFNAVRLPISFDFILDTTIKPNGIANYCKGSPCNTDVPQDSALNTFQWVVKKFTDNGIYVLIDDHYEDNTYTTNQAQWISGWQKVATMFKDNAMVGYDIYNEPDSHSLTWEGSANGTPWGTGILSAAQAIYNIDPNKLLFIEGTGQSSLGSNWGDGFATDSATVSQGISNPKNFFTHLMSQPFLDQIVISPHIYGPDGTNNGGPDHSNPTVAFAAWSRLNGYLLNNFQNVNNTSQSGFCLNSTCHVFPIALGEFGGKFDTSDPYYTQDVATLINVANYLNKLTPNPSWFYWDWNPNSGNTGGILKDDWTTIDCNKVNYLKKYLALTPASGICP
ncbi:cellulase family glycosylhydrolase [Legionella saoudiensis]|uniref:cellulase family glycosylhydrolase n=1 Tax=Legionella saoudiensis TaxID=1750561 RepID=UPI00072FFEB6|nr:cellulase family glycosylhydrolase [Legionella saoudiensis]